MNNVFAQESDRYAAARPRYPDALFDWIGATCPDHEAAWDCATGNGQAAIGLAGIFNQVDATDVSPAQIGQAFAHPKVRYSACPAEATGFPRSTFDMVAVAQALHWFDYDRFWPEVRRVARPGALFCAWGYAWFRGGADVEEILLGPVAEIVAPYWAANNRILWDGYLDRDIRSPFARIRTPELRIEVNWSTDQAIDYVRTWSAFKRAVVEGRGDELERLLSAARRRLGPDLRHDLSVPLTVAAGYLT